MSRSRHPQRGQRAGHGHAGTDLHHRGDGRSDDADQHDRAAVLGAWLGVGVVARLPRRAIQVGMGVALLSRPLFLSRNLGWMPGGGDALALHGGRLLFAIGVNFVLGALMMLGVGLYAPCLILVSLLGMNPLAAFPIMMGACAFLMPIGGARFIQANRYSLRAPLVSPSEASRGVAAAFSSNRCPWCGSLARDLRGPVRRPAHAEFRPEAG